eukprot:scaffold127284_cov18-Phaeocystis_antarctica.AAC.1
MYRQLKTGRRVCRRELLEASAQPTAFSWDESENGSYYCRMYYFTYIGRSEGVSQKVWPGITTGRA